MGQKSALLSLNQAAKQAGKSPSVIHRAIKNGRLSVVSKDGNSYQIDPSELFRVFPWNGPKEQAEHSRIDSAMKKRMGRNAQEDFLGKEKITEDVIELKAEIRVLEEVVKLREEKSAMHERRCEELVGERTRLIEEADHWRHQAERLLLRHHPETPYQFDTATETPEKDVGGQGATPPPSSTSQKSAGVNVIQGLAYLSVGLMVFVIMLTAFTRFYPDYVLFESVGHQKEASSQDTVRDTPDSVAAPVAAQPLIAKQSGYQLDRSVPEPPLMSPVPHLLDDPQ